MRKSNRKNKDNNQKKNSAKFFSNLNTSSNIEYGYDETNTKSKKFKWIFGGIVLTVLSVGVAVPWSLSSCTAQLKKPLSNNLIVIESEYNGEKTTITLDEWLNRVQSMKFDSSFLKKYKNAFNSSIIEKLYNEERDAYLKFKAIYKATHNDQMSNDFGYDLSKSASEIKEEQQKTLDKNKQSFQRSFGNDWLEMWLKELQSNSIYGPQNTDENATTKDIPQMEKKAVEYMKTEAIKKPALARFEVATITTKNWKASDLNVNNDNEIKYKDNNGKEQVVAVNTAKNFFNKFLTNKNIARPQNINSDNSDLLAVFETKSYIPEFRVPNNMLNSVITNYYKSATISSFDLSIKPGEKNSSPFTFDANILNNLFKVSNIQSNFQSIDNFIAINQISDFKGASIVKDVVDINDTTKQDYLNYVSSTTKDANLIKIMSGSTEDTDQSKIIGSSKNISLGELIAKGSSSSEGDSSSGSATRSSAQSKNFYLSALGVSPSSFTSDNTQETNYSLYEAKDFNPFQVFVELLLSITSAGDVKPDFKKYSWIETNWQNIAGELSVSTNLWNFIELLKDNLDFNNNKLSFKGTNNIDFNNQLSNRTGSLSSSDLTYLGTLFNAILIDENAKTSYLSNIPDTQQIGYWNLYKLSSSTNSQTYMYINKDGIKIFSTLINAQGNANFDALIQSDLFQTANSASENSNLYFDVSSFYSKINDEFIITNILLKDENNVDRFKFEIAKELKIKINNQENSEYDQLPKDWFSNLDQDNQTKVNDVYNRYVQQINTKISASLSKNNKPATEGISDILKEISNEKRTYDFAEAPIQQGINTTIFQTPTKYNNDALIKGLENISSTFLQRILNIVSVDLEKATKGGK